MAYTYYTKQGDSFLLIAQIHGLRLGDLNYVNGTNYTVQKLPAGIAVLIPDAADETLPSKKSSKLSNPDATGSNSTSHLQGEYNIIISKDSGNFGIGTTCIPCNNLLVKEDAPCCIKGLIVMCGHSDRMFTLTPPTLPAGQAGTPHIEVIASHNNTEIIDLRINGGPCQRGKPTGAGAHSIVVAPGDGVGKFPAVRLGEVTALSPVKIKLEYGPLALNSFINVYEFIKSILFMKPRDNIKSYDGFVQCCDGGSEFDFRVEVYPDIRWDGALSIGFECDGRTVKGSDGVSEVQYFDPNADGALKFESNLKIQHGTQSISIEVEAGKNLNNYGKIVGGMGKLFNKVLPKINSMKKIDAKKPSKDDYIFTPMWPAIEISGGVQLAENGKTYEVYRSGHLKIDFKPFFGIQGKIDILDWLLVFFGMPALAKIKKMAKKGIDADVFKAKATIEVNFEAQGIVSGAIEWNFKPEGSVTSGELKASLAFKIEGKAEVEVEIFYLFSRKAGGSAAAAAAFGGVISGSYKDDIDLDGYIEFTGLVLTAAYYGSIGGAIASSKKKGNGHPPGKTKVEVTESEEHNFEYRILDYHRWPQNDQFVKEK